MRNITIPAREITADDVFDIAGLTTVTVHRVDPIGYSHVRIVGIVGDTPVAPHDVDLEATASVTMPAEQELYVRRAAA